MKRSILLVDDNEAFLDSTKDVLEDEGYDVTIACCGEEAIRQVEKRQVHVVVMDIKMPGLNGVESLIEIKKRHPAVKVIMCTAYIIEPLIRKALAEGASAVLNKPFELSLLLRTIDDALAKATEACTILVADSDTELCAELSRFLTITGNRVALAYDGQEALKLADSEKFDILILDAELPLIKGPALHSLIRARQPGLRGAIIMGGARGTSPAIQRRLSNEKGLAELSKPLDLAQLENLLQSLVAAGPRGIGAELEGERR